MANKVPDRQNSPARFSGKGGCLIRIDDVAPNMNWEGYFRVKALFDTHGVRPVLGVIPDNRDPDLLKQPLCDFDFWGEIRDVQARGWEIAIHGHRHLYDIEARNHLGISARSEFAGHDLEVQLDRLRRAKAIFEANGVPVESFFAPSHTFDINTIEALKAIGVTSILDGYGLYPFHEAGMLFVPHLVGRTIAPPVGVHTSVHHLNHYGDADFVALERFIAGNGQAMLSYSEAKALVRDTVWNRALGAVFKRALQPSEDRPACGTARHWASIPRQGSVTRSRTPHRSGVITPTRAQSAARPIVLLRCSSAHMALFVSGQQPWAYPCFVERNSPASTLPRHKIWHTVDAV